MATVAIVQARMRSTRLPGKVMLDLAGEPMLVRCMRRIQRCRLVDSVVVATTRDPADESIVELSHEHGWNCFRGSESDVLDRYYSAACVYSASVIVRITSDSPLIDPALGDRVISEFMDRQPGLDYACNFLPKRSFPRGLDIEVFKFAILEAAWKEAGDPASREHVTPYIYRNQDRFRVHGVLNDLDQSSMRWTVDTVEDLAFVNRIYGHFGHDRFSSDDVLDLLKIHPDWLGLNSSIVQKKF
jgi:spore coat polysaccharide biosynthesis protein SpsF